MFVPPWLSVKMMYSVVYLESQNLHLRIDTVLVLAFIWVPRKLTLSSGNMDSILQVCLLLVDQYQ